MTVVVACPVCHHTSSGHSPTVLAGGSQMKPDTKICQVAVRIPMPNQPGHIMAVPCGCTGAGPVKPEIETTVLKPPPKCVNPFCDEYAAGNSSFCSDTCKDSMIAMIQGGQNGEGLNSHQPEEQGEIHSAGEGEREHGSTASNEGLSAGEQRQPSGQEGGELRQELQEVQALKPVCVECGEDAEFILNGDYVCAEHCVVSAL